MDAQKAFRLGVDPNEVRNKCFGSKYSGHWIVYVPDAEGGKRILYSSPDVFKTCHWVADLKQFYAAMG